MKMAVVKRDNKRFSKMYPEKRAVMPPGYTAELETKPIRVLIRELEEKRNRS